MKIKTISMLCAALVVTLCSLTPLSAQNREEKRVPEDQIPMAIRNSIKQEFGTETLTKKGFWSIYFERENINNRIVATPLSYIYHDKKEGEKIEIKYDAVGKFESAKGIVKKETQASGTD